MRDRLDSSGFTLMEMLIVLAISGLIVTLSGPLYSSAVPGARMKSEAHDLVVALRDTANKAVASGREMQVRFSAKTSSYAIAEAQAVRLSAGTQLAVALTLAPGLDRQFEAADDEMATLRFFPDGSSTGGKIALRNSSRTYLIGVDWLTGRVEVLEQASDAG